MENRRDASEHGDFAEGEEKLPKDEHVGSFAEGEQAQSESDRATADAEEEEESS